MIIEIKPLPAGVIGFAANGKVNADDFKQLVIPAVDSFMKGRDELNFLLALNTPLHEFSAGSWLQDALLGLKHITHWNRAAIITESKGIKLFTSVFSGIMPGEFKVYEHDDIQKAINWLATGNEL